MESVRCKRDQNTPENRVRARFFGFAMVAKGTFVTEDCVQEGAVEGLDDAAVVEGVGLKASGEAAVVDCVMNGCGFDVVHEVADDLIDDFSR